MLPYTGDYIKHIDDNINNFKYYTFTPRPLMYGGMYEVDDELTALLIEAHRNIGFLEGLLKYASNKNAFSELMLLKECAYSLMIDYDSPTFQDILVNRGSGKGDIVPISNLELAYKTARNMTISALSLSKLCGIALYGDNVGKTIDVRKRQIFLYHVKTNIKSYNPTAPTEVLPALADISAYLYNDQDTDPLIKTALVHYQFEIIHPFEQYNGIVGRITIPMILHDITNESFPLICLSEYLYQNKNEYFDLLRTTQYSGGYIRWIKFLVKAIGETAKQSAKSLIQYEHTTAKDEELLINRGKISRSTSIVYEYFKRFPITNIPYVSKETGLSFNSTAKAIDLLQEKGILVQMNSKERNRIWEYMSLKNCIVLELQ